jgi:hypothetical protein
MALPIAANTTCDVYRAGTGPPAAPAVAAVACFLHADFRGGQEGGDRGTMVTWTHVLLVDRAADVRDDYLGNSSYGGSPDTVYVPDQAGTPFRVTFVERVQVGSASEHKRVFLDRQQVTWPSDNV